MSDFKQSLRKMDISALPHIAGELLRQLGGDTASDFRARREMAEAARQDSGENPQRSFTDFEKSEREREFMQAERAEKRDIGFGAEATAAAMSRDFASDELSPAAKRRFADGASYPRRVFPEMQGQVLSESPAIAVGAYRHGAADTYAAMEEISEFFRRDGRRYDGGFKQY